MSTTSLDIEVIQKLLEWIEAGKCAWFCTIIATYGSSPRPAGSLFALNGDGVTAGSLSGGCVEEELVTRLLETGGAESTIPERCEYGVTAEENERLGLPCGGRLEVLVEYFGERDYRIDQLQKLVEATRNRVSLCRCIELESGSTSLEEVADYSSPMIDDTTYKQTFAPRYRMLLVGAGQLAASLCLLAQQLDYRVSVCDPRPNMIQNWSGPADVELVQAMPDDFIRDADPDDRSIIITLTHDPRIDDMALMEALQQPAWYVGALGSPRTSAARRRRLLQLDISEHQLDRLHAPVGLPLGSKRPLEIAIAIIAELTALRNSRRILSVE